MARKWWTREEPDELEEDLSYIEEADSLVEHEKRLHGAIRSRSRPLVDSLSSFGSWGSSSSVDKVAIDAVKVQNFLSHLIKVHGVTDEFQIRFRHAVETALFQCDEKGGKILFSFGTKPLEDSKLSIADAIEIYGGFGLHEGEHAISTPPEAYITYFRNVDAEINDAKKRADMLTFIRTTAEKTCVFLLEDVRIENIAFKRSPGYAQYILKAREYVFAPTIAELMGSISTASDRSRFLTGILLVFRVPELLPPAFEETVIGGYRIVDVLSRLARKLDTPEDVIRAAKELSKFIVTLYDPNDEKLKSKLEATMDSPPPESEGDEEGDSEGSPGAPSEGGTPSKSGKPSKKEEDDGESSTSPDSSSGESSSSTADPSDSTEESTSPTTPSAGGGAPPTPKSAADAFVEKEKARKEAEAKELERRKDIEKELAASEKKKTEDISHELAASSAEDKDKLIRDLDKKAVPKDEYKKGEMSLARLLSELRKSSGEGGFDAETLMEVEKLTDEKFSSEAVPRVCGSYLMSGRKVATREPKPDKYQLRNWDNVIRAVTPYVRKAGDVFRLRHAEDVRTRTDLIEGKLFRKRLALAPITDRLFHSSIRYRAKGVSICLLLDESGSMGSVDVDSYKGGPASLKTARGAEAALSLAVMMQQALAKVPKIDLHVYSHESWGDRNEHCMVKKLYGGDKKDPKGLLAYQHGGENYDHVAIWTTLTKFAKDAQYSKRLCIYLADGSPQGVEYYGSDAKEATRKVVEHFEKQGMLVLCIGVGGHDPKSMFKHSVKFSGDVPALLDQVKKILSKEILGAGKELT